VVIRIISEESRTMRTTLDITGLSLRNRRILALGIRGGDGDTPVPLSELIATATGDIESLSTDDLATLVEDLRAGATARLDGIAEMTAAEQTEALAEAQQARDALVTLNGAIETRETEASERAAEAQRLLDEINGTGDESGDGETGDGEGEGESEGEGEAAPEGDGETGEGEGDGEIVGDDETGGGESGDNVVPIAASRVTRVEPRGSALTRPRRRASQPDARLVLTASANATGTPAGTSFDLETGPGRERFAATLLRSINAGRGYRGPRVELPIASIGSFDPNEVYGRERTLNRNSEDNQRKIEAVTSAAAIRGQGGICAPPPIQYDLPILGTDARPVRDGGMLARFGADRGGIRTLPPAMLSDVAGAVGVWTETNDVSPSDPAVKPCIRLDCPEETETLVDAITQCLTIGNFRARYFPEQVAEWVTKVAQQAARVAETKMLTAIGTGSTQVTVGRATGDLGTTRVLLAVIDRAGAAMRSRHRLDPDFPLRLGLPAWLLDNMLTDLAREQPGASVERLASSDAELTAFFSNRQINVTWFIDGETGQIFGAQGDGALLPWPAHAIGYFYPEGTWLGLDGGSLDIGVTRDSTLNTVNDFQMFSEIMENVHFHGYESQRLDIDICASGATSAAIAFNPCASHS
jgi:hypothetical protein